MPTERSAPPDLEAAYREHRVDGAGYALFEIPKDMESHDAEILIGDEVPGSFEAHPVPRPKRTRGPAPECPICRQR